MDSARHIIKRIFYPRFLSSMACYDGGEHYPSFPIGLCSPHHQTHFEPSFLEGNGILGRGEHYPSVPRGRC
jgi:hypothetical protein